MEIVIILFLGGWLMAVSGLVYLRLKKEFKNM